MPETISSFLLERNSEKVSPQATWVIVKGSSALITTGENYAPFLTDPYIVILLVQTQLAVVSVATRVDRAVRREKQRVVLSASHLHRIPLSFLRRRSLFR